jgi:hypothetical protein
MNHLFLNIAFSLAVLIPAELTVQLNDALSISILKLIEVNDSVHLEINNQY